MAINQTFVDFQTPVPADWLNNVNTVVNTVNTKTAVQSSISGLRTVSHLISTTTLVTGYYSSADGGGGVYNYIASDTTSADNGGTIIVAADGGRWYLQYTTYLSVKQFGAKGNGSTDDTNTFIAALAGMVKGILLVPQGTYILSNTITLGAEQYIQGMGVDATIFSSTSLTLDIFALPNPSSGISGCTITGSASRTAGHHIFATNTDARIHDITVLNFFTGIELTNTFQYVDAMRFVNATSTNSVGILISNGGDQFISRISLDTAIHPLAGLQITSNSNGPGGIWVSECDFIHAQNGVYVVATGTGSVSNLFFERVACDTSSNNGWTFITFNTATIISVGLTDCWAATSTASGISLTGSGGFIDGFYVVGVRALNNGADGISMAGSVRNVTFTGGVSSGNSQSATNTYAGVHINPNISDVSLVGIRVGPTESFSDIQKYGIQVDTGSGNRIVIDGCNLQTANTPLFIGANATPTVTNCAGVLTQGFTSGTTDGSGHLVVTHGTGITPKMVLVNVSNSSVPIVAQPDTFGSNNFRVTFWTSNTGALLTGSAIGISWSII